MSREERRMTVHIKQITVMKLWDVDRIIGLGENDKIYYYTNEDWKLIKNLHRTKFA